LYLIANCLTNNVKFIIVMERNINTTLTSGEKAHDPFNVTYKVMYFSPS